MKYFTLSFLNARGEHVTLRVKHNLLNLTIRAQRAIGSNRFEVTL